MTPDIEFARIETFWNVECVKQQAYHIGDDAQTKWCWQLASVLWCRREQLTDELGCLIISMLIEEVDHRRNHREIEKKEESDSGVLFVSHQL